MLLHKLSLQNFRSYKKTEFEFSPKLTVVVGPNTAGKTNILEAIYLLATGGSFRAGSERECILQGEELGRVKAVVEPFMAQKESRNSGKSAINRNTTDTELEIVLTTGSVQGRKAAYKRYLLNGVGRRKSDFIGNFWAVLFHPQDIEIITDSPSRRRKFLDNVLTQASGEYSKAATDYEKALRRRNKILSDLKEEKFIERGNIHNLDVDSRERLEYWDKEAIRYGKLISQKRNQFIKFLNEQSFSYFFTHMRGNVRNENWKSPEFEVEYKANLINEERLEKYAKRELAAGYTLVGPHRDDFSITKTQKHENTKTRKQDSVKIPASSAGKQVSHVNNYGELSAYGSRGEQRLGMLWLRLGEIAFIEDRVGQKPVLLLDDIFSELDREHKKLVKNLIGKFQTVLTTTDKEEVEDLIKWQDAVLQTLNV